MSDQRALAFLRELERSDETLREAVAEIDDLAAEVERVRLRAAELGAFLARLPAGRDRLEAERAEAAQQAAHALRAKGEAEESLDDAARRRSEEAADEARRGFVRTRDALRMTERRVAEVDEEAAKLKAAAADATREAAELEARARQLAAGFRKDPRLAEIASDPAPGLAGVVEWGSGARAALIVARGGLKAEREALIRQANELGSVLLGEPLLAATPATVRRRVEELSMLQR
jgi:chromosome segregation ATPase